MKGKILGFTPATGIGAIATDAGDRYAFDNTEWRSDKPIASGMVVDFDPRESKATAIYPVIAAAESISVDFGAITGSPGAQRIRALATGTLAFPLALLLLIACLLPALSSPIKSASLMSLGDIPALLNMGQGPSAEIAEQRKELAKIDANEARLTSYLAAATKQSPGSFSNPWLQRYNIENAQQELARVQDRRIDTQRSIDELQGAALIETLLPLRFIVPLAAISLLWLSWSNAALRLPSIGVGIAAVLAFALIYSFKSGIGTGNPMIDARIQSLVSIGFGAWLMLATGIGLVLSGFGKVRNPLAAAA